ncbi:nucleotide exchange factor GrpE [Candidatus Gottesmanbacteria bacterium]|nr:nucleotide exchange factor GrpE [Candidatus Gottesmanbacteria bacterium]
MTDEEKNKTEELEAVSIKPEDKIVGDDEDRDEEKVEKRSLFSRKCKNCEKVEVECAEYKAGWQRVLADYKNLQTEIEKRRGEWAQMSEMQALGDFLPVFENFKKAFSVVETQDIASPSENWRKGIEHIMKQFADVLKQHGIEEIETVGKKFDPALHEAAGEESVDGKEAGEIVREVAGGYKMVGKVICAAKVIVAK